MNQKRIEAHGVPVLFYVVCPRLADGKTEGQTITMVKLMTFQNLQIMAQNQLQRGGVTIIRQVLTTTAVAAGQQTQAGGHIPIAKAYGHVDLEDPSMRNRSMAASVVASSMNLRANKNKSSLGVFFSRLEVLLATAFMRDPRTQPQDRLAVAYSRVKANHHGGSALVGCARPGVKYPGQ